MVAAGQSEILINIKPQRGRLKKGVIFIITAMEAYKLIN
jgi:hypothetical protein